MARTKKIIAKLRAEKKAAKKATDQSKPSPAGTSTPGKPFFKRNTTPVRGNRKGKGPQNTQSPKNTPAQKRHKHTTSQAVVECAVCDVRIGMSGSVLNHVTGKVHKAKVESSGGLITPEIGLTADKRLSLDPLRGGDLSDSDSASDSDAASDLEGMEGVEGRRRVNQFIEDRGSNTSSSSTSDGSDSRSESEFDTGFEFSTAEGDGEGKDAHARKRPKTGGSEQYLASEHEDEDGSSHDSPDSPLRRGEHEQESESEDESRAVMLGTPPPLPSSPKKQDPASESVGDKAKESEGEGVVKVFQEEDFISLDVGEEVKEVKEPVKDADTEVKKRKRDTVGPEEDFIPLDFDDGGDSKSKGKMSQKEKKRKRKERKKEKQLLMAAKLSEKDKRLAALSAPARPWIRPGGYLELSGEKLGPLDRIGVELIDLAQYLSPTPAENMMRDDVYFRYHSFIKSLFRDVRIELFGSAATNLVLPMSDLDIVLLGTQTEKQPTISFLGKSLRKSGMCSRVQVIRHARVPIVKAVDALTGICLDFSFDHENGLANTIVIQQFIEAMPPLRILMLFFKTFLDIRKLNEPYSGGVGSYALLCMLIHHLQQYPEYCTLVPSHLGYLLAMFLYRYGIDFNYRDDGVSVREGGSIFSKAKRGWFNAERPNALCIEDPQNVDNDLGKVSFQIAKVKRLFARAHSALMDEGDGDGAGDGEGKAMLEPESETSTLLSRLIVFTSEFVSFRKNAELLCGKRSSGIRFDDRERDRGGRKQTPKKRKSKVKRKKA